MAVRFDPLLDRATLTDLETFEQQNHLSLPSDYRDFLLASNGAVVRDGAVLVPGLNQDVDVDVLFGLGSGEKGLLLQTWLDEFADEMPSNTVVIATDAYGGLFILIGASESVEMCYWDHQHSFPSSSADGNTYPLASSFTDWIRSIQSIPNDARAT